MATTKSANVSSLYADVVGSLIPYVEDQVLLPQSGFIRNFYDISGQSGAQIKIPVVNAYVDGQAVTEGSSISGVAAAENAFIPTSVTLSMSKFGSWSDISEEAIEDGGMAMVRSQLLARLSGGIAQAIDVAGFSEIAGSGATNDGVSTSGAAVEVNAVMGPDSLAYGVKREPTVTTFYNNDTDLHNFRATVRAGYKTIASDRIRLVAGSNTIASASNVASLDNFQKSVSNLRSSNAPAMDNNMYAAFIGPATEFALVSELNHADQARVPSLSDIGNQALLGGLLGSAVGCMFFRTNNLTTNANAANV